MNKDFSYYQQQYDNATPREDEECRGCGCIIDDELCACYKCIYCGEIWNECLCNCDDTERFER